MKHQFEHIGKFMRFWLWLRRSVGLDRVTTGFDIIGKYRYVVIVQRYKDKFFILDMKKHCIL